VGCGERCTVFMESDLVAHQRTGAAKDDIVAGLAYSIASNYLNRVVGDRRIGDNVFFQGGVAWNKGVVAAFEKLLGKTVTVPPHHDVTGAIGAAILSIEKSSEDAFETSFRGFDLHKRKYEVSSFLCEDCSNQCEIRQVDIEDEAPLYYGSRCEKYDIGASASRKMPEDFFRIRRRALHKRYRKPHQLTKDRGRLGIPRVLHYFEFYPFWSAFFESLGYQVVQSDLTDQPIVSNSLELFSAETCFPVKLVYGHVANLLNKNVDAIFLPTFIKVADENESRNDASFNCPYVQTIPASVRARFDFESRSVDLIDSPVMLGLEREGTMRWLRSLAKHLKLSDREYGRAVSEGMAAWQGFREELATEGKRALSELAKDEKMLVVVSRPYNGHDDRLSMKLPEKIRALGLKVIPMDMLPVDQSAGGKGNDGMYWRYGRRIMDAARFIRSHPNLYPVYITSFGCGPDSFILHYFRRTMAGKPYLQVELDEHSADAGLVTRCEAFIDSLRFYDFKPPVTEFNIAKDSFRPFEKTIYIPNMCDHSFALRAAFERYGLTAEVMDESNEETVACGSKFTSGKECFPCVLTTGDMIKKIHSSHFDRKRSVFFMPGADGPCRFGQYSQFHRIILDEQGFSDVPIFSPNSRDGYTEFGLEGTGFRHVAWKGLLFVDLLTALRHRVRPYEVNRGSTDRLYADFMARMDLAICKDLSLHSLAAEAGAAFSRVKVTDEKRPLVGVVGEIYLRSNRFSNNRLIEKLEALGLEVRLASFTEWPLYTALTYQRDAFLNRDLSGMIRSTLQLFTQHWQERKLHRATAKYFPVHEETPVREIVSLAERYLKKDCKGEAILSIGKAMELVARQGADGVVNAMPFNCMPGTIVSSLSGKVSKDLGSVPWLNISYEGLRDSGEETRLEAFSDQVLARFRGRKSLKPNPARLEDFGN
ncbi:MAG: acyl-CoA dehydratase activase-related protein, partial [candidate division Zixibacteria bacterium]